MTKEDYKDLYKRLQQLTPNSPSSWAALEAWWSHVRIDATHQTVKEYCSENNIDYCLGVLWRMSDRAMDICMERGLEVKKVTALRPWQINAYPIDVLKEIARDD